MTNPNPNPNRHSSVKPLNFLINSSFLLLLLLSTSLNTLAIDSDQNHNLEWEVVTNTNFSTQIHLHHHVLLLVTVPWSGESRSLMKKVADAASYKMEKLDSLRLMVLYKDKEKMLADALGATDEITILFFYHSVSFKYQGKFRAQNILSSYDYLLSSQLEELPLKLLNTPENLDLFMKSTDKTVLLFEFCGWTYKLLDEWRNNGSKYDFPVGDASDSGIISGAKVYGETNKSHAFSREKKEKGMNNEKLTCDTNSGLGGIPWMSEFTSGNHSASSETENTLPGMGHSCTFDEFQKFKSLFSNFLILASDFFLPPERQRFGLISERHLLSSLDVRDRDSWFVMIHFAGCSNCSKIIKEGDDLKTAFITRDLLVTELESERHDVDTALPGNRPSIILFVDRSSESLNTRTKSKEALETFRNLALHSELTYRINVQDSVADKKLSDHAFRGTRRESNSDPFKLSRKDLLPLARAGNFENKMSVMIVNENGNIELDENSQGRSIQEILTHLLQRRNEAKLSNVAKEVGFQLLSDDFEVKLAELIQPQEDSGKSDKVLSQVSTGINVESDLIVGKENTHNDASSTPLEPVGHTGVAESGPLHSEEEKITYIVKNTQIVSSETEVVAESVAQDLVKRRSTIQVNKLEVQPHYRDSVSFYFHDGGSRLVNSLTSSSEVPSMIIFDPSSEQHFIYPQEGSFNFSSLQGFIEAFLSGSLIPYQRSESVIVSPREATHPPFINLDFHEVDSIPQVTTHTFSDLVLGFNQSENKNISYSWNKDVLVLFSSNWCGFCQRMELVVREVFRAFKGYLSVLKSRYSIREPTFNIDIMVDANLTELPLIYLMDCTLNDCSALLKSMGQTEVYPALLLFPAQRKTAVSYQGDMSVNNIIKFLIDHGSNSHHLIREEGILWSAGQKEEKDEVPIENAYLNVIQLEEDSVANEQYQEVQLNKMTPASSITLHTSNDLDEATPNVAVGSVLIATDKLLNAPPFDKSVILIVQANRSVGFQGLIINKQISWESFEALTKGIEFLREAPLSFGGPLVANGMPLVSLTRRVIHEGYSEILPSIYFLDQLTTVREIEGFKLGNQFSNDYWFFLGYASWGWEQLFAEIVEGAWHISENPLSEFKWPRS